MIGGARARVVWNTQKVWAIVQGAPALAHQQAAKAAAEAAAAAIKSKASGALANDVRQPKPTGPNSSWVGSTLPYARIQHFGGTIHAHDKPMVIHSPYRYGAGARSLLTGESVGGQFAPQEIVGYAWAVTLPAKRYLDAAPAVYVATLPARYRALFPR